MPPVRYVGGSITPNDWLSRRKLASPNAYLEIDEITISLDAFGLRSRGPLIFDPGSTRFTLSHRGKRAFLGLQAEGDDTWYWFTPAVGEEASLKEALAATSAHSQPRQVAYGDISLVARKGAAVLLAIGILLLLLVTFFGSAVDRIAVERPVGRVSYDFRMMSIALIVFGGVASLLHLTSAVVAHQQRKA